MRGSQYYISIYDMDSYTDRRPPSSPHELPGIGPHGCGMPMIYPGQHSAIGVVKGADHGSSLSLSIFLRIYPVLVVLIAAVDAFAVVSLSISLASFPHSKFWQRTGVTWHAAIQRRNRKPEPSGLTLFRTESLT